MYVNREYHEKPVTYRKKKFLVIRKETTDPKRFVGGATTVYSVEIRLKPMRLMGLGRGATTETLAWGTTREEAVAKAKKVYDQRRNPD